MRDPTGEVCIRVIEHGAIDVGVANSVHCQQAVPADLHRSETPAVGGNIDIDAAARPTEYEGDAEPADDIDRASPRSSSQNKLLSDEIGDVDEKINVEGILDCVTDPRKRTAFHLFMDGVPFKTKKKNVESIAQALNISEKTARTWVNEVRQLLAEHEGVKHLKKLRVGVRS